jgi:hypothetical protein
MPHNLSSVDKISEPHKSIPALEESKKNAFADIFNNLENMSNTSTLFDGISDEENEKERAKPSQQGKNGEQPQDESKHSIDVSEVTKQTAVNFDDSDNFVSKTRSMKLNSEKIYDPMVEIAKLKDELRIKDAELQRLKLQIRSIN